MQTIGRYEIVRERGRGGMAIVYQARDPKLDRVVAIKLIQANAFAANIFGQIRERFEREARALARLDHPNIVKVLDYGEHEGAPFLVMEYLEGVTLKEVRKPLRVETAVRLIRPIADALNYVHGEGMLHRDVKPSNIMITKNERILLTDFGIAKWLEEEENQQGLTGTGVGIGTPEYMSPEQGLGKKTDGRADEYSLSIVFYELITGRKPFHGETALAVLMQQASEPVPDPREFVPELNESVKRFFDRALAKKPEDRYGDLKDYLRDLDGLALQARASRAKESNTSIQLKSEEPTERTETGSSVLIGKSDLHKIRRSAEGPGERPKAETDEAAPVLPSRTVPKIEPQKKKRRMGILIAVLIGFLGVLALAGIFMMNARVFVREITDPSAGLNLAGSQISDVASRIVDQEIKAVQATQDRLQRDLQSTSQAGKDAADKTLAAAVTQAAEAEKTSVSETAETEDTAAKETLNAAIAQAAEIERILAQQTSSAAMIQSTAAQRTVEAMELIITESVMNLSRTETAIASVPPTRVPTKTPIPPTPTRSIGEIEATLAAASGQGTEPFLTTFRKNLSAIKMLSQRISVPSIGKIDHVAGNYIQIYSDGNISDIQDFILEVKMDSPYAASFHGWDFGAIFRFYNSENFAQLIIFSDGTWKFLNRVGLDNKEIDRGTFGKSILRTAPNSSNSIRIVAIGKIGLFYLNERFISKLDLSNCADSGGLSIGIGFYDNMKVVGYSTRFREYAVWEINGLNIIEP